jgi:putative ABC transport system substrate-binding protein
MSRRLLLLAIVTAIAYTLLTQRGDAASDVARVGYLDPESRALARWGWPGFWKRMRELGWIEGSNLIIEARFADGHIDRLPALAKELIQRKVDVIFTYSLPGARAAKDATSTTPIVAYMSDPVGSGLVASLSHPDGNLTGVSSAWGEGRGGKWLELLQEAIPGLSTAAVIAHPEDAFSGMAAKQLKAAAATRGVKLRFIDVRESTHLERAFELARRQAQAVIVVPGPFTNEHREEILALAARFQLPDLYGVVENGKLGGLIAYGIDSGMMYRHAAEYVDKVLRGAKPGELPIEQATHFSLSVNLKRAKSLGITIPESILLRADEVIR